MCFHADSKTIELKVDINDHIQMERRQMEQRVRERGGKVWNGLEGDLAGGIRKPPANMNSTAARGSQILPHA